MPIDIDKLLQFRIPVVRERVTPRDTALYALSVGMGRNPLDSAELHFVDPLAGPVPLPSQVLVMAHPGFWLGHPESGVDALAVLHGAQAFTLLAPIPVDGEVESRTSITSLVDKGPGAAALIYTTTELTDATGQCFARLDRTTFIRGGGGFGGEAGASSAPGPAPQGEPTAIVDLPTTPGQALLYRLNGDLNPLHSDPAVAARSGFARPILHGLCTMGVIVHALLRECFSYQPERLGSVSLRFSGPVYPGETIRTEIWPDGLFRARVVERDAVIADHGHFTLHPAANETLFVPQQIKS